MANNALTGFAVAFVTAVITSIILPVLSKPELYTDPSSKDFKLSVGQNFTVTCFSDSAEDDQITSMQWSIRNRTIVSGRNEILVGLWKNQLTFTIPNLAPVHRGTYQCSALYKNQTLKTEINLEVDKDKPYFQSRDEIVLVAEFSNYSLTCHAYGAHPIKYSWVEGIAYITRNDDKRSISKTTFSSTLNFHRITSKMDREYKCYANNAYGSSSKTYQLQVTAPNDGEEPTFQNNFETIVVTELSKLEILCQANGTPLMEYKWYDQNELDVPLFSTSPPFITETSSGSLLIIPRIKTGQRGSYTCSARNGYGLTSKVYRVDVIKGNGTTEQMLDIEEIEVTKVTANSVTFGIPPQRNFDFIDIFYKVYRAYRESRKRVRWDQGESCTLKNLIISEVYDIVFELSLSNIPIFKKSVSVPLLPAVPEVSFMHLNSGNAKLWIIQNFGQTVDMHQVSYQLINYQYGKFERTGCNITTLVPVCHGRTYAISGLLSGKFYEIHVRAHTKAGFGEPNNQTVYIP